MKTGLSGVAASIAWIGMAETMGQLVELITPYHTRTKRDYLARMVDDKVHCMEKAREYGLKALNRALEGIQGTTAVHICFGYAAIIHERPSGYSFLPELAGSPIRQISIETAQSKLDCKVLASLSEKKIMVGCIDLADMTVETPDKVAERVRRALKYVKPEDVIVAPDCGMKYLPREVADAKMRAMVDGAKLLRAEYSGKERR